ncbi:4a-hydroxytetrahydrobiopterin dehydratase [Georgenia sp. 10Sc9-8]|uniref:Putative pterin-4-alpha-carbinolamine dehydratase n=1 Tax=Georgenia halotolerans TaxID=3028317 RepID=A0ABT5TVJ7_9MICO|nr:4a-hydroxytetrahydrobiopterin dehydratase [Georgenia halotolerans]
MANDLEKQLLTAAEAQGRAELADWRVLRHYLHATFRTGAMTRGIAFVERIGAAAEELNHHPDVDLRYFRVHLKLTTHSAHALTEADAVLAQEISRIAADMGLTAEPAAPTDLEIAVDALDIPAVQPFWRAVLGYRPVVGPGEDPAEATDLEDAAARGPAVWFQQMDAARPQRNRIHVDVNVPHDQAQARIDAALSAGGHLVSDAHAPAFWVLADAEGNEACVCTWQGREQSVAP